MNALLLVTTNMEKMKRDSVTEQAVDFILRTSDESVRKLRADDVARAIGVKRADLSRTFKKKQGISISTFIDRDVIHRAVLLMENTGEITVKKLAKQLGFRKVSKFEELFEGYLCAAPSLYLDAIKKREMRDINDA